MNKICILIVSLMTAFMFAGCQDTPSEEVVIAKDAQQMIDTANNVQNNEIAEDIITIETLNAPETMKLTLSENKLKVNVDAKVAIPDAVSIPIVRVEGCDFLQEQVSFLFDYLCGDTDMYCVPPVMSKEQIENEIITYKMHLAIAIDNEDEGEQQIFTDLIAEREKQLHDAPNTVDMTLSNGTLYTVDEKHPYTKTVVGQYTTLNVTGGNKSFLIKNNSDRREAISFVKEGGGGGGRPLKTAARFKYKFKTESISFGMGGKYKINGDTTVSEQPLLANITLSPQEALNMAEQYLGDLGVPMVPKNIYLIDDTHNDGGVYYSAEHYAFEIECARVVNGIPCAVVEGSATGGADMFTQSWSYESLIITIDDNGIRSMEWTSPINILETVVENSAMLPFDEIQNIFVKMMPIIYEYEANEYEFGDTEIKIDYIELALIRTSERNSITTGLLVPAWRFYGTKTQGEQTFYGCWLTVNAVDGSVINTDVGY